MKKLVFLCTLILFGIKVTCAQNYNQDQSFYEQYIKTSDLIIEGSVTKIEYFQDTTISIKMFNAACLSWDKDGKPWLVRYEITLHKIFKGAAAQKVYVVDANQNGSIFINGKEIELSHSCEIPNALYMNRTGIYFLKKSNQSTGEMLNSYLLCGGHTSLGRFEKIAENSLVINDGPTIKEFYSIDELYQFIEKKTGQKKKDITNKRFTLLNSSDKVEKYILENLGDSAYSPIYREKIRAYKIK